jgi:hypothetical protein
MLEKTKLEEISLELPERERRELLARIMRALASATRGENAGVNLEQEEREKLVKEDMQTLSPWVRFVLWLWKLFSGRSPRELFIDWKIGQLKRRIKSLNSGLTGFRSRDLSPKFARLLYELYRDVFPLRECFQDFHNEAEFRDRAILYLVERRYPDSKRELEEFFPLEDMEKVFAASGSEEEVRRVCLNRIGEYVKKIPERFMNQLDEGLRPFFYLKYLVLFPFGSVFRHFKVDTPSTLDGRTPEFKTAAAMLVLEQLERLYHSINLPAELGTEWFCHEEIFQAHLEYRRSEEHSDELAGEEKVRNANELTAAVLRLADTAKRFDQRVPLLDLIRYFRKDPYYRIVFGVPRFHVKPVYSNALKTRILDQLESQIDQVKKDVLERRLLEIFKTNRLTDLFYYVDRDGSEYRTLNLPDFGHTTSLKVLYNFLSRIYKSTIQDAVQVANMYILVKNRIVYGRLNQSAAGLEELEAKILLFDRSLSRDEDDGKILMRLRHHLSTDLMQQKQYRSFVAQKDREARELVEQGYEHLLGIKRIFEELLVSPMENLKAVLRTLHFYKGKNVTLSVLLRGASELINDFLELLSQLLELEKGT